MAVERAFLVKLLADTSQMTKAFKDVGDEVDKGLSGSFNKVAIASAAAFAGLTAFAGKAAFAAAEDAAEQEKLATSLRNTVGATDEVIEANEGLIASLAKTTTFSDSELRPALDSLVRATGNLGSAQQQLTLAQDIAAGTGRPLVDVADALAKANAGNMKSLQALSPAIRDNIKDGQGLNSVLQELANTFGGQASAQAQTLAGQMTILRNEFGEAVESIGAAFLPTLQALVTVLRGVADIVSENSSTFAFLIVFLITTTGIIIGLAAAMKIYTVMTTTATVATSAFGASLTATGIGAIVVLIGLLVAGLVIAAQKSEGFRNAFVGAINLMLQAFEEFINYFIFAYNKVIIGAINGMSALLKLVGIDLGTMGEIGEVEFGKVGGAADDATGRISIFNAQLASTQAGLVRFASGIRAEGFARMQSAGALEAYNAQVKQQLQSSGGARKATEDAVKPLEAYTKVLKGAQSASDSYERSTRSLRDAKKGLKDADETLLAAQEALTKAQQAGSSADIADAQRAVAAAERNITRGRFDQEQSIFAVRDAEAKLAKVRADSGSSAQDIREAEIALEEAKLAVKDGEDAQIETAKRLETARRDLRIATEGLKEGDEELIPIKDAVTRAQEAQIKASEAHTDAINDEKDALAEYRIELDKLADAIIKFPKVAARIGSPDLIPIVPAATTGSGTGGNGQRILPDKVEIMVNTAIVNPLQVAQEFKDYLDLLDRSYGTYSA